MNTNFEISRVDCCLFFAIRFFYSQVGYGSVRRLMLRAAVKANIMIIS